MTLGAPLALLGLLAVALPIVIHLLTRHRARPQPFPTLRLLPTSPILPRRRVRLTDLVLLAMRAAIIGLAAVALAQPRFGWRGPSKTSEVSRFIILDSSASMNRPTLSASRTAFDSADALARSYQTRSGVTLLVGTTVPNDILPAAGDWLRRRPGNRELVIISDFQSGTLDSVDLAPLPADAGIRLVRIPVQETAGPRSASIEGRQVHITTDRVRTAATWTIGTTAPCPFELLAGHPQQARDDAQRASAVSPCGSASTGHPATIIYMGADEKAGLAGEARQVARPWMARAIQRLHDDPALAAAAAAMASRAAGTFDERFSVVLRDSLARPVLLASSNSDRTSPRLLLWWLGGSGTLGSAALLAALPHALSDAPPVQELDATFIAPDRLRNWERAPSDRPTVSDDRSEGRWVWGLVLLLLLAEWLIRRRPPAPAILSDDAARVERAA